MFCSPGCRSGASFHRYQCQLNLYHHRQVDTEDAFNIFMVLQTLWQKPFSFWRENFSSPGAQFTGDEDDIDLEYSRYWRMMRHIHARYNNTISGVVILHQREVGVAVPQDHHHQRLPDQAHKVGVYSLIFNSLPMIRMTSYIHDDSRTEEVRDVEELLRNVPVVRNTNKPFDATELFLAEIIVNIFLIQVMMMVEIIVHIFLIQDSNSHPVFRLDSGATRNQVGLETIGNYCDT